MFVWCVSMPLHRWREGERECVCIWQNHSLIEPKFIYTHVHMWWDPVVSANTCIYLGISYFCMLLS